MVSLLMQVPLINKFISLKFCTWNIRQETTFALVSKLQWQRPSASGQPGSFAPSERASGVRSSFVGFVRRSWFVFIIASGIKRTTDGRTTPDSPRGRKHLIKPPSLPPSVRLSGNDKMDGEKEGRERSTGLYFGARSIPLSVCKAWTMLSKVV